MIKKIKAIKVARVVNFLLFLTFASCSPVFKTVYSYTPPTNDKGRSCVFQCENSKLQCEQLEDMRNERCQLQADRDYDRCESRKRYTYKSNGKSECIENCFCYRQSCTVNYENCENRYRACYKICGGKVDSETVCVSNCEKLNQVEQ